MRCRRRYEGDEKTYCGQQRHLVRTMSPPQSNARNIGEEGEKSEFRKFRERADG